MPLNYHHLRYFWFVAQEGHLTRAAKKLNLSQSALSVQIKALESSLGCDLFERRGRKLILTETGRVVCDYASSIFRIGEDLLCQIAHGKDANRRIFRVGAITTLSRNFQIEFLRPLLTLENVELVLTTGSFPDLMNQLETHHLDVALTNYVPLRDAGTPWVAYRIADQPVSLVGKPKDGRRQQTLEHLLNKHPLILPTADSTIRIAFDAIVERMDIRPNILAEVNDMTMLRLIAREKLGLALVPPIVVKDELEHGDLKVIAEIPNLREIFYAVVVKRKYPNPLLKLVLEE